MLPHAASKTAPCWATCQQIDPHMIDMFVAIQELAAHTSSNLEAAIANNQVSSRHFNTY